MLLNYSSALKEILCFIDSRKSVKKIPSFYQLTCDFCPLQVMLWGLLALLPLVEGAHMKAGLAGVGSDSARAVGLLAGQEERGLPVTLPEVAKDEEQEENGEPYSTWHTLYGTDDPEV